MYASGGRIEGNVGLHEYSDGRCGLNVEAEVLRKEGSVYLSINQVPSQVKLTIHIKHQRIGLTSNSRLVSICIGN